MSEDALGLDAESVIRVDGPWTHRDIAANGSRFHVVEAGNGPLVLLLHGFPMFWWTWRRQLQTLAAAGYRAVAMDLRGYAGSDHPPHGYDPFTLSRDVAGVIRSLGEPDAVIVGHGWGGFIAWSAAVIEPEAVRGIVPVSMPHPKRLRKAILRNGLQRRKSMYAIGFQWPFIPERSLMRDDSARVGHLIEGWSATPSWPDDDTTRTYRAAFSLWPTAHCAVEYHRWAIRSVIRSDGLRFSRLMATPIDVPVLHVQGADDTAMLTSSAIGSDDFVRAAYSLEVMGGTGHFPHEESPAVFDEILLGWLAEHG